MPTLFYVSYAALWLLVLVEGGLLLLVYRHFGLMALGTLEGVQRDGLPVGEVAPQVSVLTAEGAAVDWSPQRGRPELLLFATPDCEPCGRVLPAVARLAAAANGRHVGVTVLVPGPRQEAARLAEQFALPFPCLAEEGSGASERYRVRVTPFAFVIGEDGRILAKGLCSDAEQLRGLLAVGGLNGAAAVLEPTSQLIHPRTGMVAEAKEVRS